MYEIVISHIVKTKAYILFRNKEFMKKANENGNLVDHVKVLTT
jgi:hypothetical protein